MASSASRLPMKFSENWLRTFVNPPLATRELAQALTMAGVEVEAIEPVAPPFDQVVVGEVLKVERHPDAARLTVCQVNAGAEPLTIVCGAPNVKPGIKVPAALPGAQLAGQGDQDRQSARRGFARDALLGRGARVARGRGRAARAARRRARSARACARCSISTTSCSPSSRRPIASDCLSLVGIAREVGAVSGASLRMPEIRPRAARVTEKHCRSCSKRRGRARAIAGASCAASTPAPRRREWMVRRLARSGIRSISALVDITNYVMLELGQPLHAFDLREARGRHPRALRAGRREKLTLLNGSRAGARARIGS